MRLEDPDTRKLDVLAVGQHLDLPSGEAAGDPGVSPRLATWEADRAARTQPVS
jgi:hypothetical protein